MHSLKSKAVGLLAGFSFFAGSLTGQSPTLPSDKAKVFSTAGFYELENTPRKVFNFNAGWRFFKGDAKGAEKADFADNDWQVVCLPHSVELVPAEASGCVNYQGPAWYRKHINLGDFASGKKLTLYFEAIMGKSKVWVNGVLVAEHFGGYLPVIVDLSKAGIIPGKDCVITVLTDNSDDGTYPPGKPENALDFAYFGGIYRDAWLVTSSPVHITDANAADKVAGGGVFIHSEDITDQKASVVTETDMVNESATKQDLQLETVITDKDGKIVGKATDKIQLPAGAGGKLQQKITVSTPHLWHPDDPYLYHVESRIIASGKVIDGLYNRLGIRKIEFRGKEGFFLNNKPFGDKLIGANRHQDYAYVGNALPNTGQWRDAKKLRDAGMRIIRSAHYPQDPAFMDACDEIGLFVTVPTPGWQFWNKDSVFAARIYSDIKNMVRRDRNHTSVILWEPILNETGFPADFAKNAYTLVHQEYPYQGCFTACDDRSKGSKDFEVLYAHPYNKGKDGANVGYEKTDKCIFTREWGDNVDNWNSHNSNSRVSRSWGETPQLIQAIHYANPSYDDATSYESLYKTPAQHVGGCLWHPFDHQRGYHPDPFWGGIMDAFRQPKYSYYMFESQRNPAIKLPVAGSGPMIYIANEMTPFSSNDVVVFSNCDVVRLIIGRDTLVQKNAKKQGMPHPPMIFKNTRAVSAAGKAAGKMIAEGLIDNKVVASTQRQPARRKSQIILVADHEGIPLVADGSDFIPVIAMLADKDGNIKTLSKDVIRFRVEGEGEIIGDERIGANPRAAEWGTAPVLIRSTVKAGKIKVYANVNFEGENTAKGAMIEIESVAPIQAMLFKDVPALAIASTTTNPTASTSKTNEQLQQELLKVKDELRELKLKEVERDQEAFGEKKK
jgi:beta-galactosidase